MFPYEQVKSLFIECQNLMAMPRGKATSVEIIAGMTWHSFVGWLPSTLFTSGQLGSYLEVSGATRWCVCGQVNRLEIVLLTAGHSRCISMAGVNRTGGEHVRLRSLRNITKRKTFEMPIHIFDDSSG